MNTKVAPVLCTLALVLIPSASATAYDPFTCTRIAYETKVPGLHPGITVCVPKP